MEKKFAVYEQCAHCDKIYRGYATRPCDHVIETRCKECWLNVKHHNPDFYATCLNDHCQSPRDPVFHFSEKKNE